MMAASGERDRERDHGHDRDSRRPVTAGRHDDGRGHVAGIVVMRAWQPHSCRGRGRVDDDHAHVYGSRSLHFTVITGFADDAHGDAHHGSRILPMSDRG